GFVSMVDHRVELGIDRFDPLDGRLGQLDGGDLPSAHQLRRADRIEPGQLLPSGHARHGFSSPPKRPVGAATDPGIAPFQRQGMSNIARLNDATPGPPGQTRSRSHPCWRGAEMIKGDGNILAGLDRGVILSAYGGEAGASDFLSPQSSTALAANAFGPFFDEPDALPPLPGLGDLGWPARQVRPKTVLALPWRGGRHPRLDLVIVTEAAVIGVASRRYEPFRPAGKAALSVVYRRPVWGSQMSGFESVRDHLGDGSLAFQHLDAASLVKQGL